ncbi:MAG: co-chaperone GroES [Firmicutes bacterium]|uniref:Co-chaperonin GroES n=1 Tax=Sulfobacillus benefaciens TaxID=453960 RepID=A0A2T2X1D7_9FIRM|nr:co-chaperone GroES [Bacillota bacterium]MCL5012863.1 co-chaperone GroES [Bacillota bacterium]PSR28310.1 MAG: co-chaperone GroES [Sulfobacillus benefaciens]
MEIRPLGDHIVVQTVSDDAMPSGIVLPDTAKDNPQRGRVVAVGSGRLLPNGTRVPLEIQLEDVVLFNDASATKVRVEGHDYWLLKEDDVFATLSPSLAHI